VLSIVAEVLTNGAAGVGCQELEGSGFGGGSSNDDGVLEAVTLVEESHDVRHSGTLLTDSDVDAVQGLAVFAELVDFLLVDDGIDGDGSLSGLSVSNNKLTLSSANWHLANEYKLKSSM
jgi:hypothetical protein